MPTRYFFPYVYLAFGAPLAVATVWTAPFVIAACLLLAAISNRRLLWALLPAAAVSLLTFVMLLAVVQTAVCTTSLRLQHASVPQCLLVAMLPTVLLVAALTSIIALAACHEQRRTLVDTANGLWLARRVRIILAIAAAMIGEFRKAFGRVHHAAAARGEASPRIRPGNLKALPRILAATWASVLKAATERIQEHWSSHAFWDRYIPVDAGSFDGLRDRRRDCLVLLAAAVAVVVAVAGVVW